MKHVQHYMSAKYFDQWEVGAWLQWGKRIEGETTIEVEVSKEIASLVSLEAVEVDGMWHFPSITVRFVGDDRDTTYTPELVANASLCLPAVK